MNELYLLRHFRTQNNINNIISGNQDISMTDIVSNTFNISYPVTKILCSPLSRCIITMERYIKDTGCECECIICDNLEERDMGILSGIPKSKAADTYPMLFECCGKNVCFNPFNTPPSGESFDEFKFRIEKIVKKLDFTSEKYMICRINQTLKMIYHIVKGITVSMDSWKNLNFDNGVIYNVKF